MRNGNFDFRILFYASELTIVEAFTWSHTEFFSGGESLRIQVVLIPIIASWGSGALLAPQWGPGASPLEARNNRVG